MLIAETYVRQFEVAVMCSAASANVHRIRADVPHLAAPKPDPLAEHKARMEREHQATLRRNQRGLWILAAIVVAVIVAIADLAGVLP
jgi:hypothetical protein